MDLVFVVSGKSPSSLPGGLGAYSYNSARVLSALGHRTMILGYSDREETTTLDGIPLLHIRNPFQKLLGLGAFLAAPRFVRAMRRVIAEENPDRVLVLSAGSWGVAGVMLREALRDTLPVKALTAYFTTYRHEYEGHVQGASVRDFGIMTHAGLVGLSTLAKVAFAPREHAMLRACDAIIVHYDSTRSLLLSEIPGLSADKIFKIPYSVDLYQRQSSVVFERPPSGGAPRVNVICRQDPRKGMATFLRAMQILRSRQVPFQSVVAGNGVFLRQHRRLCKRLGLDSQVSFPGFVPSVEEVLDHTDVYVLPSVEEGSGAISLLEAMRKGVAIVTTRCDGIPEDLVNEKTALLVPMQDEVAMADAIQRLLEQPSLRTRLATAVRDDYPRRFSFESMREGFSSVLETL